MRLWVSWRVSGIARECKEKRLKVREETERAKYYRKNLGARPEEEKVWQRGTYIGAGNSKTKHTRV